MVAFEQRVFQSDLPQDGLRCHHETAQLVEVPLPADKPLVH
jgi:hypothetical protein